jgi:hypothetical protein
MIGGGGFVSRECGGHVGVTLCKKSPAKAAMAGNCQTPRGSGIHHAVLAIASFASLFGGFGESCFLSKKVAKWYKRLKDF